MAISQSFYNKLEDQFRNEFIILKNESIKSIVASYSDAIDFVNSIIVSSKNARTGNTQALLEEINKALNETYPGLERTFRNELTTLNTHSIQSVVTPLRLEGIVLTKDLMNTLTTMPKLISDAKFMSEIPAPIAEIVGVQDQVQLTGIPLSERIWSTDKRADILTQVRTGIVSKQTPFQIAENLKANSLQGNLFNNAYRLAYSETTYSYSYSKVAGARKWNDDPDSKFEIAIEQYLSPTHREYDICDYLAGTYKLKERIPCIGRHPNCNCGQRQIIVTGRTKFVDTNIFMKQSLGAAGPVNMLNDVDAGIKQKAQELMQKALEIKAKEGESSINYKFALKKAEGMGTGSASGMNNARMNFITQNLSGGVQKATLQDLVNQLNPTNPTDETIRKLVETQFGIKPQNQTGVLTF